MLHMSQDSLHMGLRRFCNLLGAARIRLMMLNGRGYREKVEKNGRQTRSHTVRSEAEGQPLIGAHELILLRIKALREFTARDVHNEPQIRNVLISCAINSEPTDNNSR